MGEKPGWWYIDAIRDLYIVRYLRFIVELYAAQGSILTVQETFISFQY